MDIISLQGILEGFNAPVNEEQAWAVCYQCADFLQREWEKSHCFTFSGLQSVKLSKDGQVSEILPNSESKLAKTEYELVTCMGVLLFQALDYGLSESEEQTLSPSLELLIEKMTGHDETVTDDPETDEGIEDAGEEEEVDQSNRLSLAHIKKACCDHLQSQTEASSHYKAVCRALVAESIELITFLEKISSDREKLKTKDNQDVEDGATLEELQKADWARLWIQVMRELRTGVKLKKKDCVRLSPVEYEMTPYEVLMKDIRAKKHNLKQVAVNGTIPQRMTKDAHDIILEFIRSRPPLHPVKERQLSEAPVRALDVREMLLQQIRSEPRLKPTPRCKVVETSRTKLHDSDTTPLPARKIIKPDLNLLDFDDDDSSLDSESDDELEDRNRVSPCPFSPITPLSPPSNTNNTNWRQTVVEDVLKQARRPPVRRHSISVCETPRNTNITMTTTSKKLKSAMECLSLTVEEVMHIRNVLTKSELESLLVDPKLHELVKKGKVCFTCLKTKFSLFGPWSTQCKFCQRHVCSKCISKMRIPTEHFENIPVYTLSPSPVGQESATDLMVHEKTGSAPNSPELSRKSASPQSTTSSPQSNSSQSSSVKSKDLRSRNKVGRSATMRQAAPARPVLQGPMMHICRDCRAMVLGIIKSSRSTLNSKAAADRRDLLKKSESLRSSRPALMRSSSSATGANASRVKTANGGGVIDRMSNGRVITSPREATAGSRINNDTHAAGVVSNGSALAQDRPSTRDFHLDLKPVYKAK